MLVEAVAAVLVSMGVVWMVFQPLIRPGPQRRQPLEPLDPEETPKGIALAALKEIEFDRETGKLSDPDYELLKSKYTAVALNALREESEARTFDDVEAMVAAKVRALRSASAATPSNTSTLSATASPSCTLCGPRPEPDAIFCSTCGRRLVVPAACRGCGAALGRDSRYCEICGRQVAA